MENSIQALEKRIEIVATPAERVKALQQLGQALRDHDPERMLTLVREAQTLLHGMESQAHPHIRAMGDNMKLLGYYYFRHGDFETAYDYYQSAIHYFIQIYDDAGRCTAWAYSCLCLANLGRWADAIEESVACLELAVLLNDRSSEIKLRLVMGIVYCQSDDHIRGIDSFTKALHLANATSELLEQISVLHQLANAYFETGNSSDGMTYALQAQAISSKHEIDVENAHISETLGRGYYLQGNLHLALHYFQQCYDESASSEHMQARGLLGQGQVYMAQGEIKKAIERLLLALPLAETTQTQPYWYECHHALADAYAQMDDWNRAFHHHKRYHSLKESVFNTQSDLRLRMMEVTFRTDEVRKNAEQIQQWAFELEARLKQQMAELRLQVDAEVERRHRNEFEKSNLLDVARKQGEQLQNLTQWIVSQQPPQHRSLIQSLFEGYLQNIQLLLFHIDTAMETYLAMDFVASEELQEPETDPVLAQLQQVASITNRIELTLQTIVDQGNQGNALPSISENSQLHRLSNRERDVLRLLAEGKATKEISQQLCITDGTVRTYRYRIMQKLEIEDTTGLIHFAILHQQFL